MSETPAQRLVYTRDGETITIGGDGFTLIAADGAVKVNIATEIPGLVLASAAVELPLAGWTPMERA